MGSNQSQLAEEMKLVLAAILVVGAFASEAVVGPSPRPQIPLDAPLVARLRANSPCAGEKCEPKPPLCDPTVPGSCEKEMLPPTQISCDSIMHCGPCTMHLHCGWCAKEKKCMAGGVTGATSNNATCTDWDYAYCSSDPCSIYGACSSCSADPMCGWCAATSTCVEGSPSGPWLNRCSRDAFSFDSCAVTSTAPALSTVVNLQEQASTNTEHLLSSEE